MSDTSVGIMGGAVYKGRLERRSVQSAFRPNLNGNGFYRVDYGDRSFIIRGSDLLDNIKLLELKNSWEESSREKLELRVVLLPECIRREGVLSAALVGEVIRGRELNGNSVFEFLDYKTGEYFEVLYSDLAEFARKYEPKNPYGLLQGPLLVSYSQEKIQKLRRTG